MKILLTGTTGYVGQRLISPLLEKGHELICCVRDKKRFNAQKYQSDRIKVIEVNFLEKQTLSNIPDDIDAAYYMIHSMSTGNFDFAKLEEISATNFKERIEQTKAKQVIYLSGIVNDQKLSKHLSSRKLVEEILSAASFHLTTLRAGIILGSGSASFEIIRDLVEKLPVMVAPKWLNTKTQPIAIRNVIEYLIGVLFNEYSYGKSFDIGGPEILTYKEMLLKFAKVRKLKRRIITVPVLTPKLSSYWLYLVTSTSFTLAANLVKSMSVEVICRENDLKDMLGIKLIDYEDSIQRAFGKIQNQEVVSSWKDALSSSVFDLGISKLLEVPTYGCYIDKRKRKSDNINNALNKIWSIGGQKGWYSANWLWSLRGFIDKLFGGVGLNRGRRSSNTIFVGDSLDFWRVIYANKEEKRLLLYAEMKFPGEAWLEFEIKDNTVCQTATYRPLGIMGRIYWYAVLPFHTYIFSRMLKAIAS
ncbi:MAG: SDR family oxidoreductase [Bacteroidales bacterium]